MNKWRAFNALDIPASNVYPHINRESTGMRASAQSPSTGAGSVESASPEKATLAPTGGGGILGQPLTWWALIFAMLIGLMAIAHRVGDDKDFGNIRMSAYNVLTISFAAIIGIGFFKVLFTRFRVPGLSEFVAAV